MGMASEHGQSFFGADVRLHDKIRGLLDAADIDWAGKICRAIPMSIVAYVSDEPGEEVFFRVDDGTDKHPLRMSLYDLILVIEGNVREMEKT